MTALLDGIIRDELPGLINKCGSHKSSEYEFGSSGSTYPGISCVTPDNPYVLHCFPPFKTKLTGEQLDHLDIIAGKIKQSFSTDSPVTAVEITGHSANWHETSQRDLDLRAARRAENAAEELRNRLTRLGLSGNVDVRPGVGLSDTVDWLGRPYSSRSATRKAQHDRALNRRVEITLVFARPRKPDKPKQDDPTPEMRHRFIVVRGDTTDEVRNLALQSAWATFKAQDRMEYLEGLSPRSRRKEWNQGPERTWFGRYGASRRAHSGKVKRRIDLMASVFRGRRADKNNHERRRNRVDLLTIESFNCASPGDKVCNRVDREGTHPIQRWNQGQTAAERLQIEAKFHRRDRVYFCCHERETLGLAFRSRTRVNRIRDLIDLGISERPHKIALCPGWFIPPNGRRLRRIWASDRKTTIAHEVAHLAGAMKLKVAVDVDAMNPEINVDVDVGTRTLVNDEVYRPAALRALARVRPFAARLNAENYARYVMEFADD